MLKHTLTKPDYVDFILSITVDMDFMLIMLIHECFKLNLSEIETYYTHKNGKGKDLSELTMFGTNKWYASKG